MKDFSSLNTLISQRSVSASDQALLTSLQQGISNLSIANNIADDYARAYATVQMVKYASDGTPTDVTTDSQKSVPAAVIAASVQRMKSAEASFQRSLSGIDPNDLPFALETVRLGYTYNYGIFNITVSAVNKSVKIQVNTGDMFFACRYMHHATFTDASTGDSDNYDFGSPLTLPLWDDKWLSLFVPYIHSYPGHLPVWAVIHENNPATVTYNNFTVTYGTVINPKGCRLSGLGEFELSESSPELSIVSNHGTGYLFYAEFISLKIDSGRMEGYRPEERITLPASPMPTNFKSQWIEQSGLSGRVLMPKFSLQQLIDLVSQYMTESE